MSQSFSLYTELTVRQNLDLHARLFHLPRRDGGGRASPSWPERFGLVEYLDETAENLPLGVRQRLSLAVAVIHEPEMLILDEPTSGVDPVARDRFWELLIDLSRNRGVTIFISTHFMNEAERCDRISLMHAGRVLAQGAPAQIVRDAGAKDLEEAFIAHLQKAVPADPATDGTGDALAGSASASEAMPAPGARASAPAAKVGLGAGRPGPPLGLRAARGHWRSARDPIRLAFALLGPILLMIVFGYGISFDVENLSYAALDRDNSPESRAYLENFSGSRYFQEQPPLARRGRPGARLRAGKHQARDRDPARLRHATCGAGARPRWRCGSTARCRSAPRPAAAMSRACTSGSCTELARADAGQQAAALPLTVETRFRYNQDFKSVYRHGAGHHHDAAGADPRDDDGAGRRAREGARLDHQLVRHAHHGARVPARQAAAVRGASRSSTSSAWWCWPWSCSRCRSRAAAPRSRWAPCCTSFADDRVRPADLELRPHADRGDLRDRDPHHPAGDPVLRPADAGSLHVARRAGRSAACSRAPTSSTSASAPSPRRWGSPLRSDDFLALAIIAGGPARAGAARSRAGRNAEAACERLNSIFRLGLKELVSLAPRRRDGRVRSSTRSPTPCTARRRARRWSCATRRWRSSTRTARRCPRASPTRCCRRFFKPPQPIGLRRDRRGDGRRPLHLRDRHPAALPGRCAKPAAARPSSSTWMPPR